MSTLPRPVVSARIEGKRTNRVRVKRQATSAGTARRRYRADPSVRGMDTVVIAVSLPIAELEQLDAICERVQMARSHLLRQAVKNFEASARLERAAMTIGDLFAANIDPGWDECQELEAAALAYRNAVRGEVTK